MDTLDKIKDVRHHIRYLTLRIRSGKADLAKANQKTKHFLKVAQDAHADWERAVKEKRWRNAQRAKLRTQRAHRKLAFWDEVHDDIKHGQKIALRRRKHQRHKLNILKKLYAAEHADDDKNAGSGFTTIDGRQVPNWMVPGVRALRSKGLWGGYIVSGYRTPEYSRILCQRICGRDSCPGICAGVSSNHTCPPTFTGKYHEGALDVTDYYRFGAGCRILGIELRNNLPNDRVHYSYTGN